MCKHVENAGTGAEFEILFYFVLDDKKQLVCLFANFTALPKTSFSIEWLTFHPLVNLMHYKNSFKCLFDPAIRK